MPAISLFHTFTRLCTEKPAKWERRTQGEKIRLLNLHFLFFFFCTFGGTKVLSRYSHLFLLLHLLQERHRVIPQQLYTIEKSEERGRKRRRRDGEREDALYSFSFFFFRYSNSYHYYFVYFKNDTGVFQSTGCTTDACDISTCTTTVSVPINTCYDVYQGGVRMFSPLTPQITVKISCLIIN